MNELQCKSFIKSQLQLPFGKPGEWIQYGIEKKDDNRIIGDCAIKLQENNPRIAEIGITISHLYQKKGFAKEAMLSILSFLFNEKKLHRIVERVDAENIASIHLLKSVGFKQEGHFIDNVFFKGKWGSEFQYAMLKREWDNFKT
jgi:RimJ/RimL family protein N-acetyltransferase